MEKTIIAGKTAYIIVSEGRILPTRTIIKKCKIIAAYSGLVEYLRDTETNNR